MTLQDIFTSFQKLETSQEKVEYLRWLQSKDFHYDINYTNLINYWSNN